MKKKLCNTVPNVIFNNALKTASTAEAILSLSACHTETDAHTQTETPPLSLPYSLSSLLCCFYNSNSVRLVPDCWLTQPHSLPSLVLSL